MEENKYQWHSVADRLPAKSGDYIVAIGHTLNSGEKSYIYMVISYSFVYRKWNHSDFQNDGDFSRTFDDVEYWMDIPALPVPEEQEQTDEL